MKAARSKTAVKVRRTSIPMISNCRLNAQNKAESKGAKNNNIKASPKELFLDKEDNKYPLFHARFINSNQLS